MARYRKIDTRIWNDEKFRAFSDDAQLAFFFVLTHPSMTALGAMRGTIAGLAAEKGWQVGRFADAIRDAIREGMLEVNEKACFIAARNFLRYNEPEGPNSVSKAWVEALDLIPECPEKRVLIARCHTYLYTRSKKFRDAMPDGIWHVFKDAMPDAKSDASPIPEQEPEQEQEQEKPSVADAPVADEAEPADPRHAHIRGLIQELHLQKFRVTCPWDGGEGKALDRLLSANPSWSEEEISRMVHNRFASEAVASDRPRKWLSNIGSYAAGPLDRFNRLNVNGNGSDHRPNDRKFLGATPEFPACPLGECDGSGWYIDSETRKVTVCRCQKRPAVNVEISQGSFTIGAARNS
jgi:hypothetical protein